MPGAWVEQRKVGAVGIGVRRGVSLHGFALNINPDLQAYTHIVPCGLVGVGVTSLQKERGCSVVLEQVVHTLVRQFERVFAVQVEVISNARCPEREGTKRPVGDHQSA